MSEVIVRLKSDHIKVKGGEYVQDLVRCKDCRYWEQVTEDGIGKCKHWNRYNFYDFYCEEGAVRDE